MDCGSTLFIKCILCELMKNYLRHNEYFSRSQTNQNAEALERQFLSNSHLCYVVIRMPTSVGALKTKVRAFLLKTMVELRVFSRVSSSYSIWCTCCVANDNSSYLTRSTYCVAIK